MTVKRCANCAHPVYRHEDADLELCRVARCACPGFLTVAKGATSPLDEIEELREAIQFWAIPTLTIFAEGNAGVRETVERLRAVLHRESVR